MPDSVVTEMLKATDNQIYSTFLTRIISGVKRTTQTILDEQSVVGVSVYPKSATDGDYYALRVYSPTGDGLRELADDPEHPYVYRGASHMQPDEASLVLPMLGHNVQDAVAQMPGVVQGIINGKKNAVSLADFSALGINLPAGADVKYSTVYMMDPQYVIMTASYNDRVITAILVDPYDKKPISKILSLYGIDDALDIKPTIEVSNANANDRRISWACDNGYVVILALPLFTLIYSEDY